ncbi:unnamed protein product [Strongylus vulgaris]|uniref:Uncharacterized protein n=1 Tax=Strongylus vulgaris TaxID=40348 RepID=A0A3P7JN63_STRVU|nr:unnamed protein product [Strongylus vulgaris]
MVERLVTEATDEEHEDDIASVTAPSTPIPQISAAKAISASHSYNSTITNAPPSTTNFLKTTSLPTTTASTSTPPRTTRVTSNQAVNTPVTIPTPKASTPLLVLSTTKNSTNFGPTTTASTSKSAQSSPTKTVKVTREATQNSTVCVEEGTCYADSDCGQGVCLGVFLGKCNCHSCIANVECADDSDCGGLRNACQEGICRCAKVKHSNFQLRLWLKKALAIHGFTYYIDALTKFCSQRTCTETSDSCFGLPCSRGICSCK